MVKFAQDRVRIDRSDMLNGAIARRIFVQRPMRSDMIVIASVGSQDVAQMRLTQDDKMIHTFTPVCTENLDADVVVMKSAKDRV
jgi:hypothetical protein